MTRKKNILRSLLTSAFIAVISFCHAQDSSVFFRLDKEEILIMHNQVLNKEQVYNYIIEQQKLLNVKHEDFLENTFENELIRN